MVFTAEEAKAIGEKLGLKWDKFDVDQLIGKIALAHLNEFPDYYDRLEKMEREAEEFWEKD